MNCHDIDRICPLVMSAVFTTVDKMGCADFLTKDHHYETERRTITILSYFVFKILGSSNCNCWIKLESI